MLIISGKKYVTQKEAGELFYYSVRWFETNRQNKRGPAYVRIGKKRIYYELLELEAWFKKQMKEC